MGGERGHREDIPCCSNTSSTHSVRSDSFEPIITDHMISMREREKTAKREWISLCAGFAVQEGGRRELEVGRGGLVG